MIREVNINDVPGRVSRWNNQCEREIRSFLESGWAAGEIGIEKYKDANCARNGYQKAARRINAPVEIITRNGRLFIISTKPSEE